MNFIPKVSGRQVKANRLSKIIIAMGLFSGLFGCNKEKVTQATSTNIKDVSENGLPPVPEWEPKVKMPIEKVVDRFSYYTNGSRDFVVFTHGTCVIVEDGLSDQKAVEQAMSIVSKVFNYHPDMSPQDMDDGNMLISYNHPAYNVVLKSITNQHMAIIEKNHQKALARDEVLITPLGSNKFDEFGMQALFGRCYFFMDAKDPVVAQIVRKAASR